MYFFDIAVAAFAAVAALFLGFGPVLPPVPSEAIQGYVLVSVITSLICYPFLGLYRRVARSSSFKDVQRLITAAFITITGIWLVASGLGHDNVIPLNVFIIQFLIVTPALAAVRFAARGRELLRNRSHEQARIPVLVVGTGATCDLFLRSLRAPAAQFRAIGIIDDARGTTEMYFGDVRIVDSVRNPASLIDKLERLPERPEMLLLTEPVTHFDSDGIRRLLGWADGNGVKVSALPDIGTPRAAIDPRHVPVVSIDPETILDRPQMRVQKSLLFQQFTGRRVLVTGGGGSIGSELARQLAALRPQELVLIESCELNAYNIDMALAQYFPDVPRKIYVSCIRNKDRVDRIFAEHRPEFVFNAAALKHVPLVEMNPCDGVLTNIIGARNVADASRRVGVLAMVQISTDKAVNTTNVMGATKRVAEFYCQAQDRATRATEEQTRFFVVRFGNVLGSSGSLIPLFQRQIAQGGPLTVTDPNMERYFMSIREAVELTLLSAAAGFAENSELGRIFVLDMGKPVRILDLAERMIRMAGKVPGKDIEIKFVGIRPGEKLFEELFDHNETVHPEVFPGVRAATPMGVPIAALRAVMQRLEASAVAGDVGLVRHYLRSAVPGYEDPTQEGGPVILTPTPVQPLIRRGSLSVGAAV
ncbi:polysaccharide biosynthesis protein [Paracoccus benzoatiresistens]|uniref:Nucleoside-diphosphate sugar epimerase/dehydratase n=1 Tax=Paracoccus benzoatiresistens TaxID=2997341 RepID=A0ABT4J0M2_9RHOB|nr:nucleoside-diphosphate sugar epimerase/dehydratase [Paracoccus sp. EF6]MCZ0960647.1 nucleoside-diphosphate sugar epimerase/dehydratase [Paracoccus sp. EF6]